MFNILPGYYLYPVNSFSRYIWVNVPTIYIGLDRVALITCTHIWRWNTSRVASNKYLSYHERSRNAETHSSTFARVLVCALTNVTIYNAMNTSCAIFNRSHCSLTVVGSWFWNKYIYIAWYCSITYIHRRVFLARLKRSMGNVHNWQKYTFTDKWCHIMIGVWASVLPAFWIETYFIEIFKSLGFEFSNS